MTGLTFSAIVPTFNRAHSLGETLDSILSQDQPPEEVIVVDDGSIDNTSGVIAAFGDRIIPIVQQNAGVATARNAGAAIATSDWLTFCDSDDVWCEGRMRFLRQDLATAPRNIIAHVGDVRFVGHGQPRCWFEFLNADVSTGQVRIEARPLKVFLHSFSPIAAALRRDIFNQLGGFDMQFRTDEDSELAHRFADCGAFMIRGDTLAEARRQPDDDIALSGVRRKDPLAALRVKQVLFQRILDRTRSAEDRNLAKAALSATMRHEANLVRRGVHRGSVIGLLGRSVGAHHNRLKGLLLAARALVFGEFKGQSLDRT